MNPVIVTVTRELSLKGQKKYGEKFEIACGGVLDHLHVLHVMPSQRSPDKETLSFYVPRTLGRRLRKLAKSMGVTLTDIVVMVLTNATKDTDLTPEDYEQIAADTRRASQRKDTKRTQTEASRSRAK